MPNLIRSGKNIKTADFAADVVDTDTSLTADSDQRVATQKATKAYADSKLSMDLSSYPTLSNPDNADFLIVDKGSLQKITKANFTASLSSGSATTSVELTSQQAEVQVNAPGPKKLIVTNWFQHFARNTWATSTSVSVARNTPGRAGTQNAGLIIGGHVNSSAGSLTEKFHGNFWSATGNLVTGRFSSGSAGVQNAALAFAGYGGAPLNSTEGFNGFTWTNLNQAVSNGTRYHTLGTGKQYAAMCAGGYNGSAVLDKTEVYNGNAWSSAGTISSTRMSSAMMGLSNASLIVAGNLNNSSDSDVTERFNGEVWLAESNVNTPRQSLAGSGTQNAALIIGGGLEGGPVQSACESFNGFVWMVQNGLNLARKGLLGLGTQNAALAVAGNDDVANRAEAEKWIGEMPMTFQVTAKSADEVVTQESEHPVLNLKAPVDVQIENLPKPNSGIRPDEILDLVELDFLGWHGGVWATNAAWNATSRRAVGGCGTQKAALSIGGRISSTTIDTVEKFDGASWTNQAGWNLPQPRHALSSTGIQGACLSFGGHDGTQNLDRSEKFNGTSWITTSALLSSTDNAAGIGVQNASLCVGGFGTTYQADTEKFDGLNWSHQSGWDLNVSRWTLSGAGRQNAALAFGGANATDDFATAEKFNGTAWVATADLNVARSSLGGSGGQNAALAFSGLVNATGTSHATSERFNGAAWHLASELNTPRNNGGSTGTQNAAACFSGKNSGGLLASTELFQTELSHSLYRVTVTY